MAGSVRRLRKGRNRTMTEKQRKALAEDYAEMMANEKAFKEEMDILYGTSKGMTQVMVRLLREKQVIQKQMDAEYMDEETQMEVMSVLKYVEETIHEMIMEYDEKVEALKRKYDRI